MLRSRMLPDGFKLFFGICLFALGGVFIVGVGSVLRTAGGPTVKENLDSTGIIESLTGPLSVGWKGSVGNHLGYTVLFVTMVAAGFIAFLLVAFRDADPEAEAQVLALDSVPLTRSPAGLNFAPIIGAVAVGLIGYGWIKSTPVFYGGLVLLAVTIGAWTLRAWAERATGDDEVNAAIYHRIIDPLRVPVLGSALIAFVVLGISRVFSSAPSKDASTLIFLVAGVIIFGTFVLLALAPDVPRILITVLLVIGALAVLGGAIYGFTKGARPVEPHGGGGTETHEPAGTGGEAPAPGGHKIRITPNGAGALGVDR